MEVEKNVDYNKNINEDKPILKSEKYSEKKMSLVPHLVPIHICFKLMKKKILLYLRKNIYLISQI